MKGTVLGIAVAIAALGGSAIGVWTKLQENRDAARKSYTDGLAATERAYTALSERMIAVEARLDVLMHGTAHPSPPPVPPSPPARRTIFRRHHLPPTAAPAPPAPVDAVDVAVFAGKKLQERRVSAPTFKALMDRPR